MAKLLAPMALRLENTAKWVFFASTTLTAICHYVIGPGMIGPRLPQIGELASSVVGRPVRVGRCKLFSFPGILGVGPVLEVGPLVVGAETTGGEKINRRSRHCENFVQFSALNSSKENSG